MTIAITGATGNLGRLVIDELLSRVAADQIVALVRDASKAADLAENARLVLGGPDLPRIPELQMIDDATIAYLPQAVAGTVLLSEWEGA